MIKLNQRQEHFALADKYDFKHLKTFPPLYKSLPGSVCSSDQARRISQGKTECHVSSTAVNRILAWKKGLHCQENREKVYTAEKTFLPRRKPFNRPENVFHVLRCLFQNLLILAKLFLSLRKFKFQILLIPHCCSQENPESCLIIRKC